MSNLPVPHLTNTEHPSSVCPLLSFCLDPCTFYTRLEPNQSTSPLLPTSRLAHPHCWIHTAHPLVHPRLCEHTHTIHCLSCLDLMHITDSTPRLSVHPHPCKCTCALHTVHPVSTHSPTHPHHPDEKMNPLLKLVILHSWHLCVIIELTSAYINF